MTDPFKAFIDVLTHGISGHIGYYTVAGNRYINHSNRGLCDPTNASVDDVCKYINENVEDMYAIADMNGGGNTLTIIRVRSGEDIIPKASDVISDIEKERADQRTAIRYEIYDKIKKAIKVGYDSVYLTVLEHCAKHVSVELKAKGYECSYTSETHEYDSEPIERGYVRMSIYIYKHDALQLN